MRRNLDPFDQHDDATLNGALRAAGLFSLQTDSDDARLTLDSGIATGGTNLSVGQRQIIALARAIVRSSKLLILDEGMPPKLGLMVFSPDTILCSYVRHWYVLFLRDVRYETKQSLSSDHKTDSIIQSSLRNELGSDVTILTIAHRLQTIMDADKIVS